MRYRRIGRSGLEVSAISLGGWLTLGGHVDRPLSIRLIEHAFSLGINLFDMADVYSGGEAERVLGEALRVLPRQQIVVATKVCGRTHPGPFGAGLSKKHIVQACEESLKRLETEWIDLYQFHAPDEATPLEESLEAMELLVWQGKVLTIGCSNFDEAEMNKCLSIAARRGWSRIVSSQPCYNLLERDAERTLFPFCEREGIGSIIYSPLAHGVLTGKYEKGTPWPEGSRSSKPGSQFMSRYLTDANLERVARLKEAAEARGMSSAVVALGWVLAQTSVASVIIGATSVEQLDENLRAADEAMDPSFLSEVNRLFPL